MRMNGKARRTIGGRILGLLLGCVLLAADLLSAVQPVYGQEYQYNYGSGQIKYGPKAYTFSTHGGEDSFRFSIGDGCITIESVPHADEAKTIRFDIRRRARWIGSWENDEVEEEGNHANVQNYYSLYGAPGDISLPYSVPLPREDGIYSIYAGVTGIAPDNSMSGVNLVFTVDGSDAFFRLTEGYEENAKVFQERYTSQTALWVFTKPRDYKEGSASEKKVRQTAEKIVNKGDSDYEKIRKVNNWVAENVWYDLNMYADVKSGKYVSTHTKAVNVLKSKRAVCDGYANLTNELLHALGIPSRWVVGWADGDHAWNEAYADGRWIILDPTWDSENRYKNGKFSEKGTGRKSGMYFDLSLETFMESRHTYVARYRDRDEYKAADDGGYNILRVVLKKHLSGPEKSLALKKGKTKQLSVKADDAGIRLKDFEITYSTDNKKVASVSKTGKVTAKQAGTANIQTKVRLKDGGREIVFTYKTKVNVT